VLKKDVPGTERPAAVYYPGSPFEKSETGLVPHLRRSDDLGEQMPQPCRAGLALGQRPYGPWKNHGSWWVPWWSNSTWGSWSSG